MSKTNLNQQAKLAEDAEADPIRLLLRNGAQQMLTNTIREEFLQYLQDNAKRLTDDGRPAVVRNGYHQQREFLTPLGNLAVQVPKIRSSDDKPLLGAPLCPTISTLDVALP